MEEIILHQYGVSPFSEKIRKILALKKIRWRSVEQPLVAPKPKLTPLTGGYRKIPVLQIGADVWCDTAAIVPRLEALRPEPSVFGDDPGTAEILAHWADHWLFLAAVPPAIVKALPNLPAEFVQDRAAMSPGFSEKALRAALPHARSQLVSAVDKLEAQLDRRRWLLGETPTVADAACFHVFWFLRNDPEAFAALVESRPRLRDWYARLDALGHGDGSPMDADEALAIARRSEPGAPERADGSDPNGIRPGDAVIVAADDYGADPIRGTVVVIAAQEIAVRRHDDVVGDVVVHFPRTGFRVSPS